MAGRRHLLPRPRTLGALSDPQGEIPFLERLVFDNFSYNQPGASGVATDFKMGAGKKEKARKEKQGKVGDGMNNVKTKGENFYRCASYGILT